MGIDISLDELAKLQNEIKTVAYDTISKLNGLENRIKSIPASQWYGKQRDSFESNFKDVKDRAMEAVKDGGPLNKAEKYLREIKKMVNEYENTRFQGGGF